ncbi:hypothetical protein OS242_09590 [Tumebacillus sp. DT12]|uniref:Uncharacterized protein n=1 Tax=Tumebacillus lacus TaxID=2995335 RepID=A0ABT3WZY4_9BACL|nr:hypothetical protein [Tumebacillus lacus]MCX7570213.1 hypothetical protein [Tumebacillus lacus]
MKKILGVLTVAAVLTSSGGITSAKQDLSVREVEPGVFVGTATE